MLNRCKELADNIGNKSAGQLVDRLLLSEKLGYEFRDRVSHWKELALQNAQRSDHLSAFVYLWIPFNAWAAAVVKDRNSAEKDWPLIQAVGFDGAMGSRFVGLFCRPGLFRNNVEHFGIRWPIFKVRALQELGLGSSMDYQSRDQFRKECLSKLHNSKDYQPRCFISHKCAGPPLDWPHTLAAIYQVRCNLFHGGKAFEAEDRQFCQYAYEILKSMWLPELP